MNEQNLPILKTVSAVALIISCCLQQAIAYQIYKYKMPFPDIKVYPLEIKMAMRQRHAALYELVDSIKTGSSADIAEFASVSLYELSLIYEEIASTGNDESGGYSISDHSWRSETMKLANQLYLVSQAITAGNDIEIIESDTGEIQLLITGQLYILSNPKMDKPFLLDERIINAMCQRIYCNPEWLQAKESENHMAVTIEAGWELKKSAKPEFVTTDGIHFVFDNIDDRKRKQIASLKVLREIKYIASALAEAKKTGFDINWDKLTIKSMLGTYDHRISLNEFGDSIYLILPELSHINNWQDLLLPWIRAQVEETQYTQYLDGEKILVYAMGHS